MSTISARGSPTHFDITASSAWDTVNSTQLVAPATATNRTGTMEEELNDAGYRFTGSQGGETAFGGKKAAVILEAELPQ